MEYIFHGNEKAIQWAKRTLDGVDENAKKKFQGYSQGKSTLKLNSSAYEKYKY